MLVHCIDNDCFWCRVTLVFVLRLNPLHVSSCEVVAWLAHLWWRLSCLSQRFSHVTSDAWSRNVIRLCGITVCVSGNWLILLWRFWFFYLIMQRSLANHSYTSYWNLLEVVPGCYILPHSSGIECLIKQDFISSGGYQLWFPAALMTNHLGKCIVDPSFVVVSDAL